MNENERIEYCLYESGLIAQGCWDELDDYAKEAIQRFAKLIVKECFRVVDDFGVEQAREPENYLGESLKVSMKITDAAWKIKEHFGVEETP